MKTKSILASGKMRRETLPTTEALPPNSQHTAFIFSYLNVTKVQGPLTRNQQE